MVDFRYKIIIIKPAKRTFVPEPTVYNSSESGLINVRIFERMLTDKRKYNCLQRVDINRFLGLLINEKL